VEANVSEAGTVGGRPGIDKPRKGGTAL